MAYSTKMNLILLLCCKNCYAKDCFVPHFWWLLLWHLQLQKRSSWNICKFAFLNWLSQKVIKEKAELDLHFCKKKKVAYLIIENKELIRLYAPTYTKCRKIYLGHYWNCLLAGDCIGIGCKEVFCKVVDCESSSKIMYKIFIKTSWMIQITWLWLLSFVYFD